MGKYVENPMNAWMLVYPNGKYVGVGSEGYPFEASGVKGITFFDSFEKANSYRASFERDGFEIWHVDNIFIWFTENEPKTMYEMELAALKKKYGVEE